MVFFKSEAVPRQHMSKTLSLAFSLPEPFRGKRSHSTKCPRMRAISNLCHNSSKRRPWFILLQCCCIKRVPRASSRCAGQVFGDHLDYQDGYKRIHLQLFWPDCRWIKSAVTFQWRRVDLQDNCHHQVSGTPGERENASIKVDTRYTATL
jgi:hypothetical protein